MEIGDRFIIDWKGIKSKYPPKRSMAISDSVLFNVSIKIEFETKVQYDRNKKLIKLLKNERQAF